MGSKRTNKLIPVDIGVANAIGAIPGNARVDHVHNHPAGLGEALHHDPVYRQIIVGGLVHDTQLTDANYYNIGNNGNGSIENERQVPFIAGTLRNFRVHLSVAPGGVQTRTFTIRINGANGTVVVTIIGAATEGSDLVNSDAIAAGDLVTILHGESAAPAASFAGWSIEFDPT